MFLLLRSFQLLGAWVDLGAPRVCHFLRHAVPWLFKTSFVYDGPRQRDGFGSPICRSKVSSDRHGYR